MEQEPTILEFVKCMITLAILAIARGLIITLIWNMYSPNDITYGLGIGVSMIYQVLTTSNNIEGGSVNMKTVMDSELLTGIITEIFMMLAFLFTAWIVSFVI